MRINKKIKIKKNDCLSLQSPSQGGAEQPDIPRPALGPGECLRPRQSISFYISFIYTSKDMCNIYIINTNICYINISHIISLQSQFISSLCSGWQSTWYLDRWADRYVKPAVRCSVQVLTLIRERPQKVSITQEIETSLEYPTLTICSPAFFDKSRHSRGQPNIWQLFILTIQARSSWSWWWKRRSGELLDSFASSWSNHPKDKC